MFDRVLNTPLHHLKTQILKQKESGSHKIYYENICNEDYF